MTFKIIFKFSNESNKMQLLICFIFYYIINETPLKTIFSSLYKNIILFFNKIFRFIIFGESMGNIYGIPFSFNISVFNLIKSIIFSYRALIIFIIAIIILWFKLKNLKKNNGANTTFNFDFLSGNIISHFSLYIYYSIYYSMFICFIFNNKNLKMSLYIYSLSDTIGRFIGNKTSEIFFKPLTFIRYLYCFYIIISHEIFKLYSFKQTFVLGLLSGSLITIQYNKSLKKNCKEEKESLIYFFKYVKDDISKLFKEDNKNKNN